jgi:hypothetical protein
MRVPEIGVGMLGQGFMGRAHSGAFRRLGDVVSPPPLALALNYFDGSAPVSHSS